ncbi:MAG: hypothetical protein ABR510_07070 [Trueperaceae bacterium]
MVEALTYRLTHRGKPAGRLLVRSGERGRIAVVEARMQLQGALGAATVTQTSRSHAHKHHSLNWNEATEGRGDGRPFEVRFDADAGLVHATIGRHDSATAPYLVAYRDPLSLVRELRALAARLAAGAAAPTAPWRVPMLGKDVVVARVVDLTVDVPGGPRSALGFVLHPGGSVVAIDRAPPHAPLRLVQRLPEGVLEALLVEVGEEPTMAGLQDEPATRDAGKAGGRKRPRRRRRSRGRG